MYNGEISRSLRIMSYCDFVVVGALFVQDAHVHLGHVNQPWFSALWSPHLRRWVIVDLIHGRCVGRVCVRVRVGVTSCSIVRSCLKLLGWRRPAHVAHVRAATSAAARVLMVLNTWL